MITLSIARKDSVIASRTGKEESILVHEGKYQEGDSIILETDEAPCHLVIRLEATLSPALVFMKEKSFSLPIPVGEKHISYDPLSFQGNVHLVSARKASKQEITAWRNLALNPYDHHGNSALFPHASANVETRGESVFAARNAIDGYAAADGHGKWPYTSWGINRDPMASLRIEFGQDVEIDEIVLYLRADFPHDGWWKKATAHFSDGSSLELNLKKPKGAQRFSLEKKITSFIVLDSLVKAAGPSPFPALAQIEAWGTACPCPPPCPCGRGMV
ncbi:carbohydrate-binding protein [Parasphaerochaeta coccoides]|uniref:Carbohydrate-binding protein n=1 Tax=Parasphaerochaeta coccoides (strain ATCC BAA-1237 / DSM 17374 / SPN1) TaxID=760011 RepID=F4GLA9_PARC1|nr:carbohydrate-binding protein [Parasphaerochaeta coccoides]AEC02941.1 hypothetical protein Spico_1743 [Parasphaerochaeta coccoides DSM 17374]